MTDLSSPQSAMKSVTTIVLPLINLFKSVMSCFTNIAAPLFGTFLLIRLKSF